MSFVLQCGHGTQLVFCSCLLTLPFCVMRVPLCVLKVPPGSLSFLGKGDFWTLCCLLGASASPPFTAVPSPPGLVPRRWCKAEKGACAWGAAEGKACWRDHRNFPINRAVTPRALAGWAGLEVGLQRGTHKQCFPFIYATLGGAFDLFYSLANMVQCLIINYFIMCWILMYYIQSRPSARLQSKPDPSNEASSLLTSPTTIVSVFLVVGFGLCLNCAQSDLPGGWMF